METDVEVLQGIFVDLDGNIIHEEPLPGWPAADDEAPDAYILTFRSKFGEGWMAFKAVTRVFGLVSFELTHVRFGPFGEPPEPMPALT